MDGQWQPRGIAILIIFIMALFGLYLADPILTDFIRWVSKLFHRASLNINDPRGFSATIILAALAVPYKVEPPGVWTRAVFGSMPKGTDRKARAITTARAQVPALPLTWGRKTKAHDGLADACCMALRALREVCQRKAP